MSAEIKKLKYSERIRLTQDGIDSRLLIHENQIADFDVELAKSEIDAGLSSIKDVITNIKKKIVLKEREKNFIKIKMDTHKNMKPFALQPLLDDYSSELSLDSEIEKLEKELEIKEKYLVFLNELKEELF